MADNVGSELVSLLQDHLNKVKAAFESRNNMNRTLKEEAIISVTEMETALNKVCGMFLYLENELKTAREANRQTYSDAVQLSPGLLSNYPLLGNCATLTSSGDNNKPPPGVLIAKATDPAMTSDTIKKLIRSKINPEEIKVGINKIRSISNGALLIECRNTTESSLLESELLSKVKEVSITKPRRLNPTIQIKNVPSDIPDENISNILLNQNELDSDDSTVCTVKFTTRKFSDSRHVVIEVSPSLRIALLRLGKVKLRWNMCHIEDYVAVTRCFKCLGFGHTSKFCTKLQACSRCAGNHHRNDCDNPDTQQCKNCVVANSFINDPNRKIDTQHNVFNDVCSRFQRIKSIVVSKTNY